MGGADSVGRARMGRSIACGLPAACIMAALVSLELHAKIRPPAWLTRVGDQSYSPYMCQNISHAALFKLFVAWQVGRRIMTDLQIAVAMLIAVAAEWIVYTFAEQLLTHALNQRCSIHRSRRAAR